MHTTSKLYGVNQVLWNLAEIRTLRFGIYLSFGACNLLFAAYAFSTAPVDPG